MLSGDCLEILRRPQRDSQEALRRELPESPENLLKAGVSWELPESFLKVCWESPQTILRSFSEFPERFLRIFWVSWKSFESFLRALWKLAGSFLRVSWESLEFSWAQDALRRLLGSSPEALGRPQDTLKRFSAEMQGILRMLSEDVREIEIL